MWWLRNHTAPVLQRIQTGCLASPITMFFDRSRLVLIPSEATYGEALHAALKETWLLCKAALILALFVGRLGIQPLWEQPRQIKLIEAQAISTHHRLHNHKHEFDAHCSCSCTRPTIYCFTGTCSAERLCRCSLGQDQAHPRSASPGKYSLLRVSTAPAASKLT